jgi:hypothetical protein
MMPPIQVAGHPVTMSSSPTKSPSTRQTPTGPMQQSFLQVHGQMVYDDGSGRRIVESRRRFRRVSGTRTSAKTARIGYSNPPISNVMPFPSDPWAIEEQKHPTSRAPPKTDLASHVTCAKQLRSPSKSKAVIIVDPSMRTANKACQTKYSLQEHVELTPPPTPRLSRLETPELSDLEDTPFCDCGADAYILKRCTCCGLEISSRAA